MTNSRTRTRAMIPNTITQRGVPVVDLRSGMCVSSSVDYLHDVAYLYFCTCFEYAREDTLSQEAKAAMV
jgi:hypothetical protein